MSETNPLTACGRADHHPKRRQLRHGLVLVALIAGVTACSPLPGDALDPTPGPFRTPPRPETGAPSRSEAPPAARREARAIPPNAGAGLWAGRYADSRGSGEIRFLLTRDDSALVGSWRLRTGGAGTFRGVVDADGRITFRMESTGAACAATLEGSAEVRDDTLAGGYHGQDCAGVVSDGRFDAEFR